MSATALNDARFTEGNFSVPIGAKTPKPSVNGVDLSHLAIALGRRRKRQREAANEEVAVHNVAPLVRGTRRGPLSANAKARLISRADLGRERLETRYFGIIKEALDKAKAETLANMRRSYVAANEMARAGLPVASLGTAVANATIPVAIDWLFKIGPFAQELLGSLRDEHEDALPEMAAAATNRLDPSETFKAPEGLVRNFVIQRENKLKDVPQNIYDEIKRLIEEGSKAGASEQEIAHTIEGAFHQVYEGRARTVARTEAASAYGAAEHAAIGAAGFGFKTWLSAHDDRVRDSHAEVDGETVPADEPFSNGLMYPGDPEGEADEVINCRCVLLAADNEDGEVEE